ncbi:MAG TPA: NADP-dependent malic enzyme [Chitinophagales bacterium]|nr:NADP-dependent malic enzyme [Chitinophagales bacterium]HRX24036.1 NADP-dependent malic enzyme [Chitinophagales bacterium]
MPEKMRKKDALEYHASGRPGKIEVVPTKATKTQRDLSLAYSPGVAEPCLEIAEDTDKVYQYTAKGNLVGVISNGTAVLGLGDIGPEASKPVMEGKGLLFKIYADIDVFDIELNCKDVEDFIRTVKAMEPTFGGINLEDIKAPECFEIERRLKAEMNIPVMHDDQHGTAVISGAALLNALELTDRKLDEVKIVVNGAGASALSCASLFVELGVNRSNIVMCDSKGVLNNRREGLDQYKQQFVTDKQVDTLAEAIVGADVFLGLSKGNVFTPDMLLSMAKDPIVFALANPDPEIEYDLAIATREDVIMATGRSDHPNQVNNVLGFPFIFRGALDVRATGINEAMKVAAVRALAQLTHEQVPEFVNMAYNEKNLQFSRHYIIPKPVDPRLITRVAPAVAKAAMETGVARKPITDWAAYNTDLEKRLGLDHQLIKGLVSKARNNPKRVVFAEADNYKILKAAQVAYDEGIAKPILLGNRDKIERIAAENGLELHGMPIIDSHSDEMEDMRREFGELLFEKRRRKGLNYYEAKKIMRERNYFGAMMVELGQADALISGLTRQYPDTIRPALQIIGRQEGVNKVSGMYILLTRRGPIFFSDTTINFHPTTEELVDITVLTANAVRAFNIQPKIALLSYSNFGSVDNAETRRISKAVSLLKERYPGMVVDGEMQANIPFDNDLMRENYPFADLIDKGVNTLIFPNLDAANISYKLLQTLGQAEAIGPVLLGLKKSVHILQLGSSIREIQNMIAIAVLDAQTKANNP